MYLSTLKFWASSDSEEPSGQQNRDGEANREETVQGAVLGVAVRNRRPSGETACLTKDLTMQHFV